ncbi:MAG: Gfo/Idh/MocA family protein [Sumerlaeia bacterium]
MNQPANPTKLRWGIIGAGNIATHAIAPAIHASANGTLYGVASRTKEKAEALAHQLQAQKSFPNYQALLDCSEVDAVYIGLPNGLHEDWVIRAAEAGKHVLCEKSLALSYSAAQRMNNACNLAGVLLMEAYMYRHHPQWNRVHEILNSGIIGEIQTITAHLGGALQNQQDHRWSGEIGGGALYDVTCYAINAARYILKEEPTTVQAIGKLREPGADESTHVILEFPNGKLASAQGTLTGHHAQGVRIIGTTGVLHVERPFVCNTEETHLHITTKQGKQQITIPGANQFMLEVEHFADCILNGCRLKYPAENGNLNTKVCELAAKALRS